MMSLQMIAWLLLGHWIGDYLLQTRRMANAKHRDLEMLLLHVLVYSAIMMTFVRVACPGLATVPALAFVTMTAAAHAAVDALSSRLTHWSWGHAKEKLFFCVLGADQVLHVIAVLGVFQLVWRN
jgi:hypothetical protein